MEAIWRSLAGYTEAIWRLYGGYMEEYGRLHGGYMHAISSTINTSTLIP